MVSFFTLLPFSFFLTGGSRSGKSAYAERLLDGIDDVVYIATAEIYDDEMQERVKKHIKRRNPKWRTYEGFLNLEKAVNGEKHYLLDCITNLISRILFQITGEKEKPSEEDIQKTIDVSLTQIKNLILEIKKINGSLILVTNEVGSSIVPMHPISRAFSDIQGIVNAKIAELADEVVLCVCGLPIKIKDGASI